MMETIEKISGPVLLEVWNSKKKKSDWLPGVVTGYVSGIFGEDFERINVRLVDGRQFVGCHPQCVQQNLPF